MLEIMGKRIHLDRSDMLYDKPFSERYLEEDWDIASGEWWIEDRWLTGRIYENRGGLIYSKLPISPLQVESLYVCKFICH